MTIAVRSSYAKGIANRTAARSILTGAKKCNCPGTALNVPFIVAIKRHERARKNRKVLHLLEFVVDVDGGDFLVGAPFKLQGN